jgi:hypothetical protein
VVPEADVVCYGLWLDDEVATAHGVFVAERKHPTTLKCMLQKPLAETLKNLIREHFYLTDIGLWILSDKAVEVLARHCERDGDTTAYDLYGQFGCALGTSPVITDPEINQLKVAVVPLEGGEFYHFGTSREMISSMLTIQNLVSDQREIMHRSRKPHPSIFIQNSETWVKMSEENRPDRLRRPSRRTEGHLRAFSAVDEDAISVISQIERGQISLRQRHHAARSQQCHIQHP